MQQKKKKKVTYKSLEKKYKPKPTISGGLRRGADGIAELLKTGKGRSLLAIMVFVPLWLFSIAIPILFLIGAGMLISLFVFLIVAKEKERKRRNIERFGKAKPSFKEAWPYAKEDMKKAWERTREQTQRDVARRDMEELERMGDMDEEILARYEAGEISDKEMEAFRKEMKKRLKRMDSKLHKLGF